MLSQQKVFTAVNEQQNSAVLSHEYNITNVHNT